MSTGVISISSISPSLYPGIFTLLMMSSGSLYIDLGYLYSLFARSMPLRVIVGVYRLSGKYSRFMGYFCLFIVPCLRIVLLLERHELIRLRLGKLVQRELYKISAASAVDNDSLHISCTFVEDHLEAILHSQW